MPKMTAAEAAIRVLETEGVDLVFGQPGAAILPLYQAMRARGTIRHVLVRHEEGGTHAAEGYSRASGQKVGVSNRPLRTSRHQHDHWAVLSDRRQLSCSLHHRTGAPSQAA